MKHQAPSSVALCGGGRPSRWCPINFNGFIASAGTVARLFGEENGSLVVGIAIVWFFQPFFPLFFHFQLPMDFVEAPLVNSWYKVCLKGGVSQSNHNDLPPILRNTGWGSSG